MPTPTATPTAIPTTATRVRLTATKTWEVVDDATAITLNADTLAQGHDRHRALRDLRRRRRAPATAWGNRPVGFTVSGTNSDSQITNTNSNGQVQFCYTPAIAGTDTLTVFADNDGNGSQNGPRADRLSPAGGGRGTADDHAAAGDPNQRGRYQPHRYSDGQGRNRRPGRGDRRHLHDLGGQLLRPLLRLRRRPVQALERERRGELHLHGLYVRPGHDPCLRRRQRHGYPY